MYKAAKDAFIRPSLLTRRSALVLKVGVSYRWKMTKWVTSYSLLYSCKRRFPRPSLLTRRSTLVLKVGGSFG